MARFTPVTTFTLGRSRSRASAAIRQDPAAMSTNTTVARSPTAARIRSSRAPRSHPVFETGLSTPRTPLICSAASTNAPASDPWQTTTPWSSFIVVLQVLPHPAPLLHAPDQPLVERGGDVDAGIAEEMHHRDDLGDHRDVLARVEGHHDLRHRDVQNHGLLPGEAGPVGILGRFPVLQLHHHLDPLLLADRPDPEQRRDVDQADAADLHVV